MSYVDGFVLAVPKAKLEAYKEMARLGGVHFYAYLCEQLFGKRPSQVRLVYLGADPQIIIATPTEQSTKGLEKKVSAIWTAVERACEHEDFRPKPSALCNWCAFKAYCPSFGGDLSAAAAAANPDTDASVEVPVLVPVTG